MRPKLSLVIPVFNEVETLPELDRRLRVEGMRPDQDPDYDRMREARMQALKLVDLQALSSQQRTRKKREKAAEKAAEKEAAKEAAKFGRSARRARSITIYSSAPPPMVPIIASPAMTMNAPCSRGDDPRTDESSATMAL